VRGGAAAPDPAMQPVPNAGFDALGAAFRSRAEAQSVSPGTVDAALRGAGVLPGVIERDRNQT
jgi:membrane-bound lytic murein transglycosylase B